MSKSTLDIVDNLAIPVCLFKPDIYDVHGIGAAFCLVSWFFPIYLPLVSFQTKPELRCHIQTDLKRSFFQTIRSFGKVALMMEHSSALCPNPWFL
jgi:hypothetical protein